LSLASAGVLLEPKRRDRDAGQHRIGQRRVWRNRRLSLFDWLGAILPAPERIIRNEPRPLYFISYAWTTFETGNPVWLKLNPSN
jgi:hypothetical protein